MKLTKTAKEPFGLPSTIEKDFKPPQLKLFIPMPDFDLKGPNDFKNVAKESPFPLEKSVYERFPSISTMPAKHPAFSVVLMHLIPQMYNDLGPLDWAWYREVKKRALANDELRRIERRVDFENMLRHLFEMRENQRITDFRINQFEKARIVALKRTNKIEEGSEHAREISERLHQQNINHWQKEQIKQAIQLFLREQAPTVIVMENRIERALTTPTLAQVRNMQNVEVTPLELVIETAIKEFPMVKKEQLRAELTKYETQINAAKVLTNETVQFKEKIHQIFAATGEQLQHRLMLASRDQKIVLHEHENQKLYQMECLEASKTGDIARVNEYVSRLDEGRKQFDNTRVHEKKESKVDLGYREKHVSNRDFEAAMDKYFPVIINGKTEHIQFNPTRRETQYGIIHRWLEMVEQFTYRGDKVLNEIYNNKTIAAKEERFEMNEHSLKDAREVQRMRDAALVRDYYGKFDIQDTLRAFNAAQLLKDWRQQDPNSAAQARVQKTYDNASAVDPVSPTASFKKVV